MQMRGVRGATVAGSNQAVEIGRATRELLESMLSANPGLKTEDIASALFTVTPDLDAAYPALGARELGWAEVPLLSASEIPVPGGLPRCIRVLLHWNTDLLQNQIHHVYLGEAASLRPDLSKEVSP